MANRKEGGSLFLIAALAAVIAVLAAQLKPAVAASVYTSDMEKCVRGVVENSKNKPNAPGIIRLLFHDAFVGGLDGSVFLTSTPFNTTIGPVSTFTGPTEQGSPSNGGLRGLEVIDEIREALFKLLKINVSCADGLAFAAREATYVLSNGKIKYDINGSGRNDGVVSMADEPGKSLPGPTYSYGELETNFTDKGLTPRDLVALSGAHAVGFSHPSLFTIGDRFLLNATIQDQIDPRYRAFMLLETKNFTSPHIPNNVRDMKPTTKTLSGYQPNGVNTSAVDLLDNSYFNANRQNMVLFTSDWTLRTNTIAEALMKTYTEKPGEFYKDFGAAMTKLSNKLPAKGPRFEIGYRKKCSATNFNTQESYPLPKP